MNRLNHLLDNLEQIYPEDQWIKDFRSIRNDEIVLPKINKYEDALTELDDTSWKVFEPKLTISFKSNSPKRGKQHFFNILNEAIAYRYLSGKGAKGIQLIPEVTHVKTPDISFGEINKCYCEVKTINTSDEERSRYENEEIFSNDVYKMLSTGFIGKLQSAINNSCNQFPVQSERNIVFLVVHFDDFTGMYSNIYTKQITNFLRDTYPNITIHLRADIFERYIVNHGQLPGDGSP
jgi:hypothetical protein